MTGEHADVGPDLQQLARTILAMLDPLVQAGAAFAPTTGGEPGRCQQVWCPVCAVAAVAAGEQHPLVAILVEHGAALLSVLRTVATTHDEPRAPHGSAPADTSGTPPPETGRYQPIVVTVHE